ncbi:hypothetical protein BH23CHL5_BH23CHL5_09270 [soil metagenome]
MPAQFHPKAKVIAAIDDEQSKWNDLVGRVGTAHMEIPGAAGDWTFKDVAAHLSFWMEPALLKLESLANQEIFEFIPSWPQNLTDPETINAWAYEQSRDRSVDDVLAESNDVFLRMRNACEAINDETLNAIDLFDWQNGEPFSQWVVDRRMFNHYYQEHEEAIRNWMTGL